MGVEDADVGADLSRQLGRNVLRVEETRIGQQQHCRPALAFDLGRSQIEPAVALELRQGFGGLFVRQQHGVAEMQSTCGIGEKLVA